jgi:hypothetical protein
MGAPLPSVGAIGDAWLRVAAQETASDFRAVRATGNQVIGDSDRVAAEAMGRVAGVCGTLSPDTKLFRGNRDGGFSWFANDGLMGLGIRSSTPSALAVRRPRIGRAISVPHRQVIFERAGAGHKARAIADDLGLNPETVRKLMARFRKAGAAAIAPDYSRCGVNQTLRADAELIAAATAMRREHPTWGAGIIRVVLGERHPGRALPSERAFQRAFAGAGLNPAPAGRRRGGAGHRAERPHETWQIDAADQIKLAGDGQASWLRIVDECSGAVLVTAVFPPRALEYRGRHRDPSDAPRQLRATRAAGADPGR